jgi:hypothetical protein
MYIKRCAYTPIGSTDWIIKGQIAIEGEFTQAEWNTIKETLMAMGLMQMSRGLPPPSELVPTREECVTALMEDARGLDGSNKLRKKYDIPPHYKFPSDLERFMALQLHRLKTKKETKQLEDNDQSTEQD